jgi:hypothetical protein
VSPFFHNRVAFGDTFTETSQLGLVDYQKVNT